MNDYERRIIAKEKAISHKKRDIAGALRVVEALWAKSDAVDPYGRHAYTPAERKAINEAVSKLRSVSAGWVNNRR
jgi:predicted DNA binding protein